MRARRTRLAVAALAASVLLPVAASRARAAEGDDAVAAPDPADAGPAVDDDTTVPPESDDDPDVMTKSVEESSDAIDDDGADSADADDSDDDDDDDDTDLDAAVAAAADADASPRYALEGAVRAGWRLLSGRGRGRFVQDVGLDDGPRVFDFDVRLDDLREKPSIDTFEASGHDLGERTSDGRLIVRRNGLFELEGSWFRDVNTYTADGDPFPRDTLHDRTLARLRVTPWRGVALRLEWRRNARRGDAFAQALTDSRESPPPGVDPEIVGSQRPFEERFDALTVGGDVVTGDWRFGLALTARRGLIDDIRLYNVPDPLIDAPSRQEFHRRVDLDGTDVVAKVGRTWFDGALETTLIGTARRFPTDSEFSARGRGTDRFNGTPFLWTTTGGSAVDGSAGSIDFDATWHVTDDLDLEGSLGREDTRENEELTLTESRRFTSPNIDPVTLRTRESGRTSNNVRRTSIEALYDAGHDVRLRAGQETYHEEVTAPFETREGATQESHVNSFVRRWVGGIDAKPFKNVDASLLARLAKDDDAPAAPSPEQAHDVTARVRWKATSELALTALHRRHAVTADHHHESNSTVQSSAVAATWAHDALTLDASTTFQSIDTETDTRFRSTENGVFARRAHTVSYLTRDLIFTLGGRYELRKNLRLTGGGHALRSRGDEEIDAHEGYVGVEYDIDEDLTAGLTGRVWRYDERGAPDDDYHAEALEAWLEFRFR